MAGAYITSRFEVLKWQISSCSAHVTHTNRNKRARKTFGEVALNTVVRVLLPQWGSHEVKLICSH